MSWDSEANLSEERFRRVLRRLLAQKDISIAQLARGVGTDYASAWHWVHGPDRRRAHWFPKLDSLRRIARFIQVPVAQLIDDDQFQHLQELSKAVTLFGSLSTMIETRGEEIVIKGQAKDVFKTIEEIACKLRDDESNTGTASKPQPPPVETTRHEA